MSDWGGFKINGKSVGECCRECTEKFPACHDVCATFLKAQAEWDEKKQQIEEAKKQHKLYDDYHYKRVYLLKKKKIMKGKGY